MGRPPKTSGLEWLIHSLIAFNGSGYADYLSPESFIDSYVAYKKMRRRPDAAELAETYRDEALVVISELLEKTAGASHKPSAKNLAKFRQYYHPSG